MSVSEIIVMALKAAFSIAVELAKAFGYSSEEIKAEFDRQLGKESKANKSWEQWCSENGHAL